MNIEDVLKGHGIGSGGSFIKSMQSGYISMTTNPKNIPINSVDLTKAIPIITVDGPSETLNTADYLVPSAQLTSSTNLQLSIHRLNANYPPGVAWTVIEFNDVKSLQSGIVSSVGRITPVTINSIDTSKSILFYSVKYINEYIDTIKEVINSGHIASSTEVQFISYPAAKDFYWYVIEFK